MDRLRVYSLFHQAVANGGRQLSPFEVEWEIHGDCTSPVRREVWGRKGQPAVHERWTPADDFGGLLNEPHWDVEVRTFGADRYGPYVVYLTARCRQCDLRSLLHLCRHCCRTVRHRRYSICIFRTFCPSKIPSTKVQSQ